MTTNEYQKWSKSTARYPQSFIVYPFNPDPSKTFPFYLCLGLAGECGEVIEIFKKFARREEVDLNTEEKEKVKLELGDLLWYFTQIATELDFSLEEIMLANQKKLEKRYDKR